MNVILKEKYCLSSHSEVDRIELFHKHSKQLNRFYWALHYCSYWARCLVMVGFLETFSHSHYQDGLRTPLLAHPLPQIVQYINGRCLVYAHDLVADNDHSKEISAAVFTQLFSVGFNGKLSAGYLGDLAAIISHHSI